VLIRSLPVVATVLCAFSLGAQNSPQISPAAPVPEWRSFIGANPLGIPLDIVSVEAETALGSGATVGGLAAYNDIDDKRYTTFDARFRYYPNEVPLRGLAVGLSFGYTHFNGILADQTGFPNFDGRGSLSAPTLGVLVDYNWTQGPSQRFVIGTGVGAKRILASREDRDAINLDRAYVTARFVLGLLF
jgi:hypothetical protein